MNPPLVSICVPIYNVAPYIERCMRSIMEQTYPNLEYVFVDDGSTDNSLEVLQNIIKEYPERNNHFTIVRNDYNRGTAYSRQMCIEEAHGEYVVFVDSDDYVEREMVQCFMDKALQTHTDIVVAGFSHEFNNNTIEIEEPYPLDNETDYIRLVLLDLLTSMCSRLFLRSLFTEGKYCYAPEGLDYCEDRLMFLYLTTKTNHIVTLNKPLYHYMHRCNSITQNKNERHFRSIIRFWQATDELLKELGLTEKYKELVASQKIENKAHLLMYCDNRSRKQFADLYAEEERVYKPKLTRGVALMYWLTKHHLWGLTYCYQCYINWLVRKKIGK